MKILIASLLVALVAAPAATAAKPVRDSRVPALQRSVRELRQQVSQLEQQLQTQVDRNDCFFAINSDTENIAFHLIGFIWNRVSGQPAPPDLARVDDHGACQRLGIQRPLARALVWQAAGKYALHTASSLPR